MLGASPGSATRRVLLSTMAASVAAGSTTLLTGYGSALAADPVPVDVSCVTGSTLRIVFRDVAAIAFPDRDPKTVRCNRFNRPSSGTTRTVNGSETNLILEYRPNSGFVGNDQIMFYCTFGWNSGQVLLRINVAARVSPWAGPRSQLGWYSGGCSDLNSLEALRTDAASGRTRPLDMAQVYMDHGSWDGWGNSGLTFANTTPFHSWMTTRECPSMNIAVRVFSASSQSTSTVASRIPVTWPSRGTLPASAWVSPRLPVGYNASITNPSTQRAQGMDVWQHAADGHFDHLWDAGLRALRDNYLVRYGLTGRRVVMRPFWENNGAFVYGTNHPILAASVCCATTTGEARVVRNGMKRFCDVARTAWPGVYLHYCPLPGGTTGNLAVTQFIDAATWDIIGPDYYDTGLRKGPPYGSGSFEDRWNEQANATGPGGGPRGINRWATYVRGTGKRLGIGEWGVSPLGDSNYGGGDNPTFIRKMFEFFQANADIMAYENYFNSSNGGHRLSPSGSDYPDASAGYQQSWTAWT